MNLSRNFPHQLALLLVALQTDKLPICQQLTDPTEKSLIAVLITFLDSKNYRTPITISRKTLGNMIRVKRSTLFSKLRQLKDKGMIEETNGELPIRLTVAAVKLLRCEPATEAPVADSAVAGDKFFRVGKYSLPRQAIALLNSGLNEQQIVLLLNEAKKAGTTLQAVLASHAEVIGRYGGDSLFFIVRDLIRHPGKYRRSPAMPARAPHNARADARTQAIVAVAESHAVSLLLPGEKLQRSRAGWEISLPQVSGGAPSPLGDSHIAMLEQRMRTLCERQQQHSPWQMQVAEQQLHWDGSLRHGQPLISNACGQRQRVSWAWLYQRLPDAAKWWDGTQKSSRMQGRRLTVRGIDYLVELICNGLAALQIQNGQSAGRIIQLPVEKLYAPEVAWQP